MYVVGAILNNCSEWMGRAIKRLFEEFGERYLDIDAILEASVILDPQKPKEEQVSKDKFTVGIPFDNAFAFYFGLQYPGCLHPYSLLIVKTRARSKKHKRWR